MIPSHPHIPFFRRPFASRREFFRLLGAGVSGSFLAGNAQAALYADPQILFLDEASSALDERTEAEIMGELRLLADEMTILAITHRKTVIRAGDNVVELTPNGVREETAA